eukprot:TRINITY_DN10829_c0_g3_i1.p1 TRINITY_DN10829_c0_g3~~TRINITY_DN10829_c0_g3_i1.p1  ORF type:complete len:124 (+),score=35.97 TRINITY_DN10829_c0_g3_i1:31-402(+)
MINEKVCEEFVRPTIIKAGHPWMKVSQQSLVSPRVTTEKIAEEQLKKEKQKSLDLLEVLSKSGAMELNHCELHVIVGLTLCFEKSLMKTLVEDNVNPIERFDDTIRSVLNVFGEIRDNQPQAF